jgi:metal-responsive CopG/Arc/MetJ family transcriptional regulator
VAIAGNVNIPESLLAEVEKAAHAENRSAEDVVKNAIERYLEERGWQKFVENNEGRARATGIGEGDVERLISEARRENEQRSH